MNQISVKKKHNIFYLLHFPPSWKKFSSIPIWFTSQPPWTALSTRLGGQHTPAMANLPWGDEGQQYFNQYCCKNFLISNRSDCQEKSHLILIIAGASYRKLVPRTVSSPHFTSMTGVLDPCAGKILTAVSSRNRSTRL